MKQQPKYLSAVLLSVYLLGRGFIAMAYEDPVRSNEPVQVGESKDAESGKMSTGEGRSDSKSKAEFVDDSTINDNVKQALERDPQLANQKVKVDTKNGVVTVSGKVNDERYRGRIIQVVQGVKGVRAVKNNITIGNS